MIIPCCLPEGRDSHRNVVKAGDCLNQRVNGNIRIQPLEQPESFSTLAGQLRIFNNVETAAPGDMVIKPPVVPGIISMKKVAIKRWNEPQGMKRMETVACQLLLQVTGYMKYIGHQPGHIFEYTVVDALQDIVGSGGGRGDDQVRIVDVSGADAAGRHKSSFRAELFKNGMEMAEQWFYFISKVLKNLNFSLLSGLF
jgi:hypothetical protein